jgi:hypothetical protein
MRRRGQAFQVRHIEVRILSRGPIGYEPQRDSEILDGRNCRNSIGRKLRRTIQEPAVRDGTKTKMICTLSGAGQSPKVAAQAALIPGKGKATSLRYPPGNFPRVARLENAHNGRATCTVGRLCVNAG